MEAKKMIKNFISADIADSEMRKDLKDDESLIETGILDSLGIMKLLTFMEKNLSLKISSKDILPENFESIDAISIFVKTKLSVR